MFEELFKIRFSFYLLLLLLLLVESEIHSNRSRHWYLFVFDDFSRQKKIFFYFLYPTKSDLLLVVAIHSGKSIEWRKRLRRRRKQQRKKKLFDLPILQEKSFWFSWTRYVDIQYNNSLSKRNDWCKQSFIECRE